MTSSHVRGRSDQPLNDRTLGAAFDDSAVRFRHREALDVPHQDVRWTYEELEDRVNLFADGLLCLGLAPGDRIGIWAPNCAEWIVAQFGTAKAGLILVNINPAYRLSELEFCLNKVGCRALITAERLKDGNFVQMLRELAPELDASPPNQLRSARVPDLRLVIRLGAEPSPGCLNFDEVMRLGESAGSARRSAIAAQLKADDAINIQFTSGTTGAPKGATLTHKNILNNGFFVGEGIALTPDDRICIPVPLYHCFGMVMGNIAAVTHGAAMIYPAESFDARRTLQAVVKERASALYGVPTMFIAELDLPDFKSFDLSGLRTGIMAGSPCPVEIMKRVIREMHLTEITNCYGMTETSPVSFQSAIDDTFERRVTTVGRVHPHLEVKIVDADGATVTRGTQGEICTRGYSVMQGYWQEPDKTREVIDAEGWMHTGDLGVIDEDGYGNVTGRLKDLIIRGGENVYPREVEEFLYGFGAVNAVQVCGVPDARFGEAVCAWIQLKAGCTVTEKDIRDYCQGKIAHYKMPRHIRFVTGFPMTVTGKIQKFAMREQMKKELGLTEQHTA